MAVKQELGSAPEGKVGGAVKVDAGRAVEGGVIAATPPGAVGHRAADPPACVAAVDQRNNQGY